MMQKTVSRFAWFFAVTAAITVNSCKHETPVATTGDVCFESEILPIFQSSCAKSGCHDAGSAAEGYILNTYQNIMNTGENDGIVPFNSAKSEIIEAILESDPDKIMPPPGNSPLTTEQKNLLIAWVNEGAPNTVGCNSSVCDSTSFQYAAHVKPIIDTYCTGCHSGGTPSGGLDISNHAGLAAIAGNGSLLGSINHTGSFSAMPQNSPQLDLCKRTVIAKWVQAGALDN